MTGLALWVASGFAAWVAARIIPPGRTRRWAGELIVALLAAVLAGLGSTVLDFGGWREPDWRAALFAFLCALASAGVFRLVTFSRGTSLQ